MKRAAFVFAFLFSPSIVDAQSDVVTYHYDNARTGLNSQETVLTPATVASSRFRKLFSQPVDGDVYAQPLYVRGLAVSGKGTHNVVFVATEKNSVFAFDADDDLGTNANYLWKASLIDTAHGAAAGATTVPSMDIAGCGDIAAEIGITSTPVIDRQTNTIYVNAKSKEGSSYVHRLHALDMTTGAEKPSWPVTIAGAANGITFDAHYELARAGLLLANGTVYIAFGSHCDQGPYSGWIFAYDTATRTQTGILHTAQQQAGIWMEGAGLGIRNGGQPCRRCGGRRPWRRSLDKAQKTVIRLDYGGHDIEGLRIRVRGSYKNGASHVAGVELVTEPPIGTRRVGVSACY
jgi:hypothetical protein